MIVVAVVLSIFAGVALGLVSRYSGGWLDRVLVVVADAIYAFPSLLLAIVMSIVISQGQSSLLGRHLRRRHLDHGGLHPAVLPGHPRGNHPVEGRTLRGVRDGRRGLRSWRIMGRHIFRNATRTLPLIFTLNASEAVLTLAGLGLLGFGIEPTAAAEWGYDLNRALSDATSSIWWTGIYPGMAIVLTVKGLTLLGESMNDLADPRLRGGGRAARPPGTARRRPVRAGKETAA